MDPPPDLLKEPVWLKQILPTPHRFRLFHRPRLLAAAEARCRSAKGAAART
jgi:hypothetical protein